MSHVEHDFDPTKFGFPPPLTRKQGLARRAADYEICEKYPNQYVAYIDTWNGEELDRRVIGTAPATLTGYNDLMSGLDPETRNRVQVTFTGEPDTIYAHSVFFN